MKSPAASLAALTDQCFGSCAGATCSPLPSISQAFNRADVADIYRVSRADVIKSPMRPDPRDPESPLGRPSRDIFIPDLRLGSGIVPGQQAEGTKIKPRDSR
jgi:error-prone DNA polymerase